MTSYNSGSEKRRRRVPAEWEAYDAVMIAWPHSGTDWAEMLQEVEACYEALAEAIVTRSGLRLLVVTPEPEHVRERLKNLPQEKLVVFEAPTNDTWTRDYGPIQIEDDGENGVADFQFNGWGLKFAANLDNMVNLRMLNAGLLTRNYKPNLGFVFEGGAMESDGEGTMLTTSECLLALNRNGVVTKEQLADYFGRSLGMKRVLFLDHGHLAGDDTDSHVDTLARLAPGNTILYVKSYREDDAHTLELRLMEEELKNLRTASGERYNLVGLPLPDAVYDEESGERLPATYANFLITPRTVLMPTYRQPDNDRMAEMMLQAVFPDREIVGVDCVALIKQHGSLHCATMQLREGVLRV
ncbi:MAG: agmatine deiminase family protein [Muribaculaceae bacterium]|nr:agmatine deiminase family protein [Muribaculaceae bacterium]